MLYVNAVCNAVCVIMRFVNIFALTKAIFFRKYLFLYHVFFTYKAKYE